MILADKITSLRKQNGWSQEELAERLGVSRQAVSKWESSQAIPDLDKILSLGELFGVTTDYLLKDEIENEAFSTTTDSGSRCVGLEEANTYLALRRSASLLIALATFLCILAPIPMILFGAASELPNAPITENTAGLIGIVSLFGFVLCAVPIFLLCGFRNEPFAFLDKADPFSLAYGVSGLVTERKKQFRSTYILCNIIATLLCIFSPIPLIVSGFGDNEFLTVIMLAVTMVIAGIGASIFIIVGVRWASMQKLLQEGDYTVTEKRKSALKEVVGFAYWGILTTLFLTVSLLIGKWEYTWLIFAIGAILFPIVMSACNAIAGKKKD